MKITSLISVLCYIGVGIVLTSGGITIATWQYWVALALLAVIDINSHIAAKHGNL